MASEIAIASHKRSISSSTLDAEPPRSKPRIADASSSVLTGLPEYVYVVILELKPAYGESGSEVRGVFCAIADANNCLKGIVHDEYTGAESCTKGRRADGRVFWSSPDVGEGDAAEISVEKQKLYSAGSYIARDWPSEMDWDQISNMGSESEDQLASIEDEEEDEEEDDEEEDEEEEEEEEEEGHDEEGGEHEEDKDEDEVKQ